MNVRWRSGSLAALALTCQFTCFPQLREINQAWEKDVSLKHATITYCVADANTGEPIADYHADRFVVPASTLKLFTTASVWGVLGNKFRFETRICYSGKIENGILKGDIYIVGSGDPSLSSSRFRENTFLEKAVGAVKSAGISAIQGHVIADASAFTRKIPDHWIWADISNYFGVVPCALNYRDNKFSMFLKTGKNGSPAAVVALKPEYRTNRYRISSEVTAGGRDDQAYVYGDPFGYDRTVRGTLPAMQERFEIEAALPDPALLCAEELSSALEKSGVPNQGAGANYNKQPDLKIKTLYTQLSPTLNQLINITNRYSDNLYCESLLLKAGNGDAGEGLRICAQYWKDKGLHTDEVIQVDGCGLSRANVVTARFMCSLLHVIKKDSALFRVIDGSLPVAGSAGGLSALGKGTFIANNLRAKTGYIERVRSYCGYVTTRKGRLLAFSLFFNNYSCTPTEARHHMEKLMVTLAEL
jgi:serine-type D-Ala-D-Ala carboxypeptidase/endopeptidase (penicillin-binding protein 4)